MNSLAAVSSIFIALAIKTTLLLFLAWCGALLLRRLSAAARHMLLAFAVVAVLLLPFSAFLPQWHVRGLPDFTSRLAPVTQGTTATPAIPVQRAEPPQATQIPASPRAILSRSMRTPSHTEHRPQTTQGQVASTEPQQAATTIATPQINAPAIAGSSAKPSHPLAWPIIWALVWVLGTAYFCLRSVAGRSRVRLLVRRSVLLSDAGWNAHVRATAAAMGIKRHVALLVSSETGVPLTTGMFYPAIILPPEFSEWSPLRRDAVLQHELAHISRMDALTQLLADVAVALYWWNPLVWLIARAMRIYRERACDDTVLASGTKASDYAHELLDFVSGFHQPELHSALAMARRSQLEGRILAVLNPALRRGSVSRVTAAVVAALTLAVVVPLAAMRPAQQQASTPSASSQKSVQNKPSPASTVPANTTSTTPSTATDAPSSPATSAEEDTEPA
ncbi:MAG TPA: M56 family metallopeptidase, partial [Candidatus Angelobacter sp.]|nr:M56 family metallopeptidase [Candidatus Angelobacter sp.]